MSDSSDPMDCSPRGYSVHGISQARILEWDAIAFSANKYLLSAKSQLVVFSNNSELFEMRSNVDCLKYFIKYSEITQILKYLRKTKS